MSEDTGRGQGVGVAWFLAGLGVGALVGILYAPKSGRETREDLAQRGREGSEYLRNRTRQDSGPQELQTTIVFPLLRPNNRPPQSRHARHMLYWRTRHDSNV